MSEKVLIDFAGAAHGHFLEYVINSWIGQRFRVEKIFTELGTCHLPEKNINYVSNRMVVCGHFSEHNKNVPAPDKLIRITVDSEKALWVYRLNLLYRPGDIGLDKNIEQMNLQSKDSTVDMRQNVYAKLVDLESAAQHNFEWKWVNAPCYEFPMCSMFDQAKFYQSLTNCAKFLNQRFIPDLELAKVWHEFIELNQGYQIYKKSKFIVENALSQQMYQFETTPIEQGAVNAMLTNILGICDGPLFEHETYPNNTIDVWEAIDKYLKDFDNRF